MIDHVPVHLHMINHNIFMCTMFNYWFKDNTLLDQEVQLSEDKIACVLTCVFYNVAAFVHDVKSISIDTSIYTAE